MEVGMTILGTGVPSNGNLAELSATNMTEKQCPPHASASPIFLLVGSNLLMRKLRIWPGSTLGGVAAGAAVPPFQRACSIEPSEAMSNLGAEEEPALVEACSVCSAGRRHSA